MGKDSKILLYWGLNREYLDLVFDSVIFGINIGFFIEGSGGSDKERGFVSFRKVNGSKSSRGD